MLIILHVYRNSGRKVTLISVTDYSTSLMFNKTVTALLRNNYQLICSEELITSAHPNLEYGCYSFNYQLNLLEFLADRSNSVLFK